MDSTEENFEKVDQEVKKLHSYKTYTLLMIKINKINSKSLKWLQNSLLLSNITE